MPRKFLTDIDISRNELLDARLENRSTPPSNPQVGQVYFDHALDQLRVWNSFAWLTPGGHIGGSEGSIWNLVDPSDDDLSDVDLGEMKVDSNNPSSLTEMAFAASDASFDMYPNSVEGHQAALFESLNKGDILVMRRNDFPEVVYFSFKLEDEPESGTAPSSGTYFKLKLSFLASTMIPGIPDPIQPLITPAAWHVSIVRNSPEAEDVRVDSSGFTGNLSSDDSNLQTALETIDALDELKAAGLPFDNYTSTAGHLSVSGTSFAPPAPIGTSDLYIEAAPGDVILLSLNAAIGNEGNRLDFTASTRPNGTLNRYLVPASGGISGWTGWSNVFTSIGSFFAFTVESADIHAGQVRIRFEAKLLHASPSKTIRRNTEFPLQWSAFNLGGGGVELSTSPPVSGGETASYEAQAGGTVPSTGSARFSTTTFSTVTTLRVHETDMDSNDLRGWLDSIQIGDIIVARSAVNPTTQWAMYVVTATYPFADYLRFTVTHVASSGSWFGSNPIALSLSRKGDKGDKGDKGNKGDKGDKGDPSGDTLRWNNLAASTSATGPGTNNLRLNSSTYSSASILRISETDSDNNNVADWLATINVGDVIFLRQIANAATVWVAFRVTGNDGFSGYRRLDVELVESSGGWLGNNAPVYLAVNRVGADKPWGVAWGVLDEARDTANRSFTATISDVTNLSLSVTLLAGRRYQAVLRCRTTAGAGQGLWPRITNTANTVVSNEVILPHVRASQSHVAFFDLNVSPGTQTLKVRARVTGSGNPTGRLRGDLEDTVFRIEDLGPA